MDLLLGLMLGLLQSVLLGLLLGLLQSLLLGLLLDLLLVLLTGFLLTPPGFILLPCVPLLVWVWVWPLLLGSELEVHMTVWAWGCIKGRGRVCLSRCRVCLSLGGGSLV